jgi:hypothetical protein
MLEMAEAGGDCYPLGREAFPIAQMSVNPVQVRSSEVTLLFSRLGANRCWKARPYAQNSSMRTGVPRSAYSTLCSSQ